MSKIHQYQARFWILMSLYDEFLIPSKFLPRVYILCAYKNDETSKKIINRPISQIPQCIRNHFATEICTHVHIYVTKWCIMGYGVGALWDLGQLNAYESRCFLEPNITCRLQQACTTTHGTAAFCWWHHSDVTGWGTVRCSWWQYICRLLWK